MERCPDCQALLKIVTVQVMLDEVYIYKKQKQCVSCDWKGELEPLTKDDMAQGSAGEDD